MDQELERFKREISLVEYAQASGYEVDRKKSSRNCVVMRGSGDVIVIATDGDGHGIYFSVANDNDNGSIIDFVRNRLGLNLGQVRKELRPWLQGSLLPTARREALPPKPIKVPKDLAAVLASWHRLPGYAGAYLARDRKLSSECIAAFSPWLRQDERGNACFAHRNAYGVTGWEVKNRGYTGFSAGGAKSLFACRVGAGRGLVVIAESAIDAMSYHQLQGREQTLYLSLGGAMSPSQEELLAKTIAEIPKVIIATDRDDQGDEYATTIFKYRPDAFRCLPVGKDWNDDLKGLENAS